MKSKKDLMDELNQEVQRTGTLTVLHTNAIAEKIGLSATEFEALDIISRRQPMSAGNLSRCCGLTTGAITGLVDRLERAGFVRRAVDPRDRRRVLLEPIEDPDVNRKVRDLYRPISEMFDSTMKKYTPEQLAFLIELQKTMNDSTERIIADLQQKD